MSAPPVVTIRRLASGYQVSQAIHVMAVLGIADLLADGPRSSDDLAAATETNADALYRLLRAFASVGVVHEDDERRFDLTTLGEGLRSDVPNSLHGWAMFVGRPYYWQTWASLEHSIRTGENAFRHVHGTDVWDYRSTRPEESAIFDRAMSALTRTSNEALVAAFDFGRFGTIVDVGGGCGTLLEALLDSYPTLHGVLFDQEHVVAGVDLGERGRVVGGSFFDDVPAGGDAYVLKAIVHDWEDEEAAAILRNCRKHDATVLVVERVVGAPNEDPMTKFGDLNMLVSPGGRERTVDEFRELFAAAGLRLDSVTPTATDLYVLEAVPA
jgi:O-methyltransferase domain/Dimerisation domain